MGQETKEATVRARTTGKLLSVALLALSGCSLFDPHPRASEMEWSFRYGKPQGSVTDQDREGNGAPVAPEFDFAGDLPQAIDDANAQRLAYLQAGDEQSYARNAGSLALVGLSAAALFLGITGESGGTRDAIAGLGVAGAGLLGLGFATVSTPRQRLYYEAARVITCSITATRPFLLKQGTYDQFTADLNDLRGAISNLQNAIETAEDARVTLNKIQSQGNVALLTRAEVEITSAREVLSDSVSVFKSGVRLMGEIDGAGTALRLHVQQVMASVDVEITKTEPTLESITALAGGLSGFAGQLVPGVSFQPPAPQPAVAPPTPSLDAVQDLKDAINDLRLKRGAAIADADRVRPYIQTADSLKAEVGVIKDCQSPEADLNFGVTPDVGELEVAAGSTTNFVIRNDTGVPTAAFSGPAPKNSKVNVRLENGAFLAVLEIGVEAGGETVLLIRNGPGTAQKLIKLKIKKAPGQGPGQQPTTKILSKLQTIVLQAHLGAKVDGAIGNETKGKITAYRKNKNLPAGDFVDDALWMAVIADLVPSAVKPNAIVDPQTAAEKQMAATDIMKLQTKLIALGNTAVIATQAFDLETRKALLAFQKASKLPETGTLAAKEIADEIQNCSKQACL